MQDLILDREDYARFARSLSELVKEEGVLSALLINRSGRLLSTVGEVRDVDPTMLGALVAGSFSSIMTILAMIGDGPTSTGKRRRMQISLPSGDRNIHISLVDQNTFLVVIFDNRTKALQVKSRIRELHGGLATMLEAFYKKIGSDPGINLDVTTT
jgi:predicted regulator of Ras-like GTPase activity (Roadblock/LC7/MglB family)